MAKSVKILLSVILLNGCSGSGNKNHSCISLPELPRNSSCNIFSKIVRNNSRSDNDSYLRSDNEIYLRKFSFIYGLVSTMVDNDLQSVKNVNLNSKCTNDMRMIKNGIDRNEVWAKKLLDSSGTYRSGFILGDNFWMGSKKGCDSVNQKLKLTLSKRFERNMIHDLLDASSPIIVNFRMIHAKHNSPWQLEMKCLGEGILHLGLCVPQSCSNDEIRNLAQHTFNEKTLQILNIYQLQPDIIDIRDLSLRSGFFNKLTVKLFVLILVATIILTICSIYAESDQVGEKRKPIYSRIIKCFSIKDNFDYLSSTDTTPGTIQVINGLRSIACFWIILPHINWFMHYTLDNEAVYFDYAEKLLYQSVSNAPILVDLFFTIRANGFISNVKLFGRLLLKRFIRLSPPYYIILLIVEIGTSLLADISHFYIHERNDLLIEKYWWRNLLYIQNLFDANDMVASWTWSLACEMQYFIVFTIILFVYAKNPDMGKKVFCTFWFVTLLMTGGVALYYNFNAAYDVWFETRTLIYMSPWARIHPYHFGILSAYYVNRNGGKICISKKNLPTIWIGSISIVVFCLYSSSIRNLNFILGTLALVAQRMSFGIAISWVIISSITGNGNWFTKFLEHRSFVHINKISYAIYLLNPITITIIYGLRDAPSHCDVITTTAMTASIGFIVYLLGLLFALLGDVPYTRLAEEFVKVDRKKMVATD